MSEDCLKLYKFKSLNNIEQVLDVIINKRLYCSLISDLNDVREASMEMNASLQFGIYELYVQNELQKLQSKRVLSLTSSYKNHLMWAHYADGYKGVVIRLGVKKSDFVQVTYEDKCPDLDVLINSKTIDLIPTILTHKYKCWENEKEYRCIQDDKYYSADVEEVIFGSRVNSEVKRALTILCEEYGISVSMLVVDKASINTKPA